MTGADVPLEFSAAERHETCNIRTNSIVSQLNKKSRKDSFVGN